ncbi:amidohydrolase family protein [Neotabrizicola shimadae]|uniref:Amidohydrolase family protein n=1 Tax=Neotabrizicola shimadae TaxID=2807096 RepID=A0A8G0ZW58_9RHOB|nr:amidohydrolase family protein [Neotabrizicola shimadae]QYZ69788.1 amidohydrolase family protein [Neotabrizicola shimadae]
MIHPLPPIRLTGADVLRDGQLQRRSVAIAEGRITRGPLPEVDLSGYLVLPGLIDLHAGGPDPEPTDLSAAAAGITTACLTLDWRWPNGPDDAMAVEARLRRAAAYRLAMRTDLRLHVDVEMHLFDQADLLVEAVRRNRISLVTFTNGLIAALEAADAPGQFEAFAQDLGHDAIGLASLISATERRRGELPRHLCSLAESFDDLGVIYATRADPDGEARERHSMIGARLAMFPASRRAAAAARAMMCPVVLSAPGILAGSLHSVLASAGLVTALASDGNHQALAAAAFSLSDRGIMPFAAAWALVSSGPAEILRLPDRGRIEPGQRADLAIVRAETRRVEATISRGRLIHAEGGAARLFSPILHPRLAAE